MIANVTFVNFFIKTYSILSIQYMYEISCKMDKHFLRYRMFFHRGPTSPPPPPAFSKVALRFSKSPVQVELKVHALPRYILTLFSHNRHDHARICILVNIFNIRSSSLKKIFCCLSHPSFWFSKAKWKIIHAENEKLENGQPSASLPLSHPHATIIRHLPHQRLYD